MNDEPTGRKWTRQAHRLQTLNEISRVVSSTLDLRTLYDTIYAQVSRVMDTTLFFLAVHRPERNAVELPYMREHGKLVSDQEVPYGQSVTTLVIQRGAPLLFHADSEYQSYARANGLPEIFVGDTQSEAIIFVPLNTGSRTIGALSVQSPRPNAYTEDDVQTLSVIAAQAAVAIENARLYQQSQDSVRQMQALLEVAQMVSGSLHVQTVLESMLVGIRDVLPYDFAAVLLPDHSKLSLDIVAARGPQDATARVEELREQTTIPAGSGIPGTVYTTGEPLHIPDTRAFEPYIPRDVLEVFSEMAVPLKRGTTVVGVLDVQRRDPGAFSAYELDLLTLFASQAAIAIENARLFSSQQDRVFELQAIQNIVQRLTPLQDIPSIAALINRELKNLIDYHSCRLFVLDTADGVLVPISLADFDPQGMRVEFGQGITGWIAAHGEPQIIPNMLEDPRASHIPGTAIREESMIGAPLVYEGKVQGVITLSKLGTDQFDENSLRLLQIIAAQTAIAFDRARLYEELRAEAITDELTQLYNRRYLIERFSEEKARAARNHHELAMLMLDIDKFKRVNDSYGHDAGDIVLQDLAALIRKVVRAEDIVARYGGEEFCILLPESPIQEAEQVAERLRGLIERHRLPGGAGVDHITVSIGMATLSRSDKDVELFSRADLAMYQVKHRGGNHVCIHDGNAFFWYGQQESLIPM
ncbi:MAG TPA: GAF domain-containing protein [Chloroflexota bacterium]